MSVETTLNISVTFPQGAYSGATLGAPEELPSPARVHEALLAAAAGGPWATADGRVLVARDDHRAALEWLERHAPLGIVPPQVRLSAPRARRYRWRASPAVLMDSAFEPRAALDGPVTYVWPAAPPDVVEALRTIAAEVTHVGRADSIALVEVAEGRRDQLASVMHPLRTRRGPGYVMPMPQPGRTQTLVDAHREASARGPHTAAATGRQVYDQHITGANETATALCRFEPPRAGTGWPYGEVWTLRIRADPETCATLLAPSGRVPAAVGIHRAIVRRIGDDVPPFVTGRDGDGPLRGPGHLAIQLAFDDRRHQPVVLLGIPRDVGDADRQRLLAAVTGSFRAGARQERGRTRWFTVGGLQIRPALPFWIERTPVMRTAVPLTLDVTGRPRRGEWSLADSVVCSVGYAMRGVLEEGGLSWGRGWSFRRLLVDTLRDRYGVNAIARRVASAASRFVHRAEPGELVVAVHAAVNLGRLAPEHGGFLALGRARHLGGGLLVPAQRRER